MFCIRYLNHLNHPTFSQEYLNLLHKENGMELNQAEDRIQEMGSTSGRIKTPAVGRRGYRQWSQPGIPGLKRVQGSLYSNDRLDFSLPRILKIFFRCFYPDLYLAIIDSCCWVIAGYLFLRWSVAVRTVRAGSLTCWRQKGAEPPLVSTGGRNKIIWGSPAGLEEEIPSLTERKWETGRQRNMRIPTVNTSQY